MISPNEDLPPVQLPDPALRTAPYAEIAKMVDGIIFPNDAVPPFHEVAVHLAKRIKRPVTMTEDFGMVKVKV